MKFLTLLGTFCVSFCFVKCGMKISEEQKDALCADKSLANICATAGPADDACKNAATTLKGSDPKCTEKGTCAIVEKAASAGPPTNAPGGTPAPGGTTAPKGPTTVAAGGGKGGGGGDPVMYVTKKTSIPNYEPSKKCSNGLNLFRTGGGGGGSGGGGGGGSTTPAKGGPTTPAKGGPTTPAAGGPSTKTADAPVTMGG